MLCIAHRISTIMDSHRVMVLERGRLVEFDKPSDLMERREPQSLFRSLAVKEQQRTDTTG